MFLTARCGSFLAAAADILDLRIHPGIFRADRIDVFADVSFADIGFRTRGRA
jgi:hypothetical protein